MPPELEIYGVSTGGMGQEVQIYNCGWVPGYEVGYGSVLRDQVVVKDQNDEVHKVSESPGNEMLLPKQTGSLGCFDHG